MAKFTKPTVFILTKRKEKPALTGRHYPSYFRVPSEEEVFDEEKNQVRTIRYAIGETSIYKDEQPEKVTLGDIVFVNGTITVDRMNPNLLKFLSISNHNEGNENRNKSKQVFFRILDPAASAKASIDNIVLESKAVALAISMEFSKLVGYAKTLNINVNREADEIRHDMILFAKSKPKMFMDGIDDPSVARQTLIDKAKELGILTFEGRSIKWNTGGKASPILTVPVGMKTLPYFAEWTMNDKDGQQVFDEIEKRVAKATSK